MMEYFNEAIEEIKRVDHLVYVSLKYTRTVDVLKSVIERLINAFHFATLELLEYAKDKKKIKDYPAIEGLRIDLLLKIFSDNQKIKEYFQLYQTLRMLSRADYTRREEYRRHVTMIATFDDGEVMEIDIDKVEEYYYQIKDFMHLIKRIVMGEKDE